MDLQTRALLVLIAASLSAGLGWAGLLVLRHRNVWQVVGGVLLRAGGFAGIRLLRAVCVWLALTYLLGKQADFAPIAVAVALGCAPLIFGFLHFIPHFGWIVLGVLEALAFVRTVSLLEGATGQSAPVMALTLAGSWLLVWLTARSFETVATRLLARHVADPRRLRMVEVLKALPDEATTVR